jgi:hypothetical protein
VCVRVITTEAFAITRIRSRGCAKLVEQRWLGHEISKFEKVEDVADLFVCQAEVIWRAENCCGDSIVVA